MGVFLAADPSRPRGLQLQLTFLFGYTQLWPWDVYKVHCGALALNDVTV